MKKDVKVKKDVKENKVSKHTELIEMAERSSDMGKNKTEGPHIHLFRIYHEFHAKFQQKN